MFEEIDKNYKKVLTALLLKNLPEKNRTSAHIAAIIATAVLDGKIKPGSLICTQEEFVTMLKVDHRVIEKVWKLLKYDYELIVAKKTLGTYIVRKISAKTNLKILSLLNKFENNMELVKFDDETMVGFVSGKRGFDSVIHQAFKAVRKVEADSLKQKVIPELLAECRTFATQQLSYPAGLSEIFYSSEYMLIILSLCRVLLKDNAKFVVIKPTSFIVENAVHQHRFKLHYLGLSTLAQRMDELEEFCQYEKAGIVYLSLGGPYPEAEEFTDLLWMRLKVLQKMKGFIILIDDRQAGSKIHPSVFKDIAAGHNKSIIYIAALCLLNLKISDINAVVAPKYIVTKLKRKFKDRETLVQNASGYGLLKLMRDGDIRKYSRKAHEARLERVDKVKEVLLASGLFVNDFITQQQGWYFYLEPVDGLLFPVDIAAQLAELNLIIMSPEIFRSKPFYTKGIMISVSSFETDWMCLKGMEKLLESLKKMIAAD